MTPLCYCCSPIFQVQLHWLQSPAKRRAENTAQYSASSLNKCPSLLESRKICGSSSFFFLHSVFPNPSFRPSRVHAYAYTSATVMSTPNWWTAVAGGSSTFPGVSRMAPGCWSWEETIWARLEPMPSLDCGLCECWCWPTVRYWKYNHRYTLLKTLTGSL